LWKAELDRPRWAGRLEYYPDPPLPDSKAVDETPEEMKALILGFEASAAMLRRVSPF